MRPVLKEFFEIIKPERYLEIGYGGGANFESVPLELHRKVCISTSGAKSSRGTVLKGRSDDVFKAMAFLPFDLIFVDGGHEYRQVMRDIVNSVRVLSERGLILVHDVNPLDKGDAVSMPEKQSFGGAWCGDGWKAILHCMGDSRFGRVMAIEEFPGWLCIWNPGVLSVYHVPKDCEHYSDLTIQWAREHRDDFQFMDFREVAKAFKNDHRTHGCI